MPMLCVAVIDGPYNTVVADRILSRPPVRLGETGCSSNSQSACRHGTFILTLLGAAADARFPGLCPDCKFLHYPLFVDDDSLEARVADLAQAIKLVARSGGQLINLSLALLDGDLQSDPVLAEALDEAESSGAILVVAAGNQGRLAAGQLISHPVTLPVVAADQRGRILPDSNFGPLISRRGVAAPGHEIPAYGPDGNVMRMSGTSVATAVATGILAQVWASRPRTSATALRSAVLQLGDRKKAVPPLLRRDALLTVLDGGERLSSIHNRAISGGTQRKHPSFLGESVMKDEINTHPFSPAEPARSVAADQIVAAAQSANGCQCGGSPGACTCMGGLSWPSCANGGTSAPNFVYVLGTVDVCVPNPYVGDELSRIAEHLQIEQGRGTFPVNNFSYQVDAEEDLRGWCYRILSHPAGAKARYIARQLKWILTVETIPAYYICLTDPCDLDNLISLLAEPQPLPLTAPASTGQATGSAAAKPPRNRRASKRNAASTDGAPRWPNLDRDHGGFDLCKFIGTSSLVPVEACPGTVAPVLLVDHMRAHTLAALAPPGGIPANNRPVAPVPELADYSSEGLFKRLVHSADNFGDTDEWRALNFLAVEYPRIYRVYADMLAAGYILQGIKVVTSRLSGNKRIVDPVFTFRNLNGGEERLFVRIDVTDRFPTIVNHLSSYFERW